MDSANAKNSLNFDFSASDDNNADFENLNLNSDDSDMVETSFEVN